MLNRCEFIGNLGQDPEIRRTPSGDAVANMRIAVSTKWTDKASGERKEKTEWIPVVAWGKTAEIAERYLKKGMKVFVAGEFTTRSWEKDGQTRYSTEVVLQKFRGELTMLDGKPETGGGGYSEPNPDAPKEDFRNADLNDSIPFLTTRGIW